MTKTYKTIESCRLCYSKKLSDVLDLGDQPPANSLRSTLDRDVPTAPLKLVQCQECSGVQLTATVDPSYLFDHYVWVTGTSATARNYGEYFCAEVIKRASPAANFVVEVASNDGTFLKSFKESGLTVLGVDPAKNIAKNANDNGIPTLAEFFNDEVAQNILRDKGNADIVFARNVIPHVKEIHSIIKGLSDLAGEKGVVVIEFHYAKVIIDELHYDSIYHEHLYYYSLKSLNALLQRYSLHAFDAFRSPISGGSLVLFYSKEDKGKSPFLEQLLADEEAAGLNSLSKWQKFALDSTQHAKDLKQKVIEYAQAGKLIGYGASARSSTMLNFAGIGADLIECIIDRNPIKQGLYTPGTDIPIASYEDGVKKAEGGNIILLAWNFEEEIVKDLRDSGFSGDIIVPLPNSMRTVTIA
jgi:hypothetical protein